MKFQFGFLIFFTFVLTSYAEETPAPISEKVCDPEKEFTKDCNVCKCNPEGTQFTCDNKVCGSQKETQVAPENGEKCAPGEIFKNKCNECHCPESGLKSEAACTVIGCPDE